MELNQLLHSMVESKASDLHFKAGAKPLFRVDGDLRPQSEELLTIENVYEVVSQLLDDKQKKVFFEDHHEIDLAYSLESIARFRCNVMWQRGLPEIIMRLIPQIIPRLEDIHLPLAALKQISLEQRGLILVTGITGSGKSTTLAAMINEMNENRAAHIVTIEDPIEFVHVDKRSSVSQREVGIDTASFQSALKYVLRQDPDVILIGEMRDMETVQAAITAAETGHLVLSTLHTMDTTQTIERILDFFPPEQQNQIRIQLSNTLKAVISQRLVSKTDKIGLVPACEIMIVTPTIKSLIFEGKISSIKGFIAEGGSQYGMQTFDQSLIQLVRESLITRESAMEQATSPSEIDLGLKGISSSRASAQSLITQMELSQQKERMSSWFHRAQEYYDKRRYDEARIELKRILQEKPDHPEANALMAELRKLDAQSDRKKDASINLKAGLQFYREGKIQSAIVELKKGLEIDPNNKQIETYIQTIQKELENQVAAREYIQQALQLQNNSEYEKAYEKINEALAIDSENEQAIAAQKELKNSIQKQQFKKRANELNQKAIECYQSGDLLGALVTWQKAYEINTELEEVAQYLQQGTQKLLSFQISGIETNQDKDAIFSLFEQGIKCYIHSDFTSAITLFKKAISKAPGNAYLEAYLVKSTSMLEQQIEEIYKNGMEAMEHNELLSAQQEFNKVLKISAGHPNAVRQLDALKVKIEQLSNDYYQKGKEAFEKNEFDKAIQFWNKILEYDASNDRVKRRIEEAKNKKGLLKGIFSKIG
jgi:twitching motility protein PilT